MSANAKVELDAESIGRLALLSFKEGQARLSKQEAIDLAGIAACLDQDLRSRASECLNELMRTAYLIGHLAAMGEA